jgi:hypothetical protein
MSLVDQDEEHLKLLSILYYVWAGLTAFGACFGGIYVVAGGGLLIAAATQQGNQNAPPPWFGAIFLVLGAIILLLVVAISLLNFFTGRFLARRQRYTFCFVVAVLSCLSFPLGTALGIFTIIVLQRPSVKAKFGQTPAPA